MFSNIGNEEKVMSEGEIYSRREILQWGLMTGGVIAASVLRPGFLRAQQKNALENYFEKYGYVQVYDNIPVKSPDGRIVEQYVPYNYVCERITVDGFFRPIFPQTNTKSYDDMMAGYNSVPPAERAAVWRTAREKCLQRDLGGENRKDFERETAKITPPGPNDYPCQLNDKYAGIVINSLRDDKEKPFPGGVSSPRFAKIDRKGEISGFTPLEEETRKYRMIYDSLGRRFPEIRAIANKYKCSFFVMLRKFNSFEEKRHDPGIRLMILMQDPRDGIYRLANGHLQEFATDLNDGKAILDQSGNKTVIPGYEKAKIFNLKIVDELIELETKIIRDVQAKAMVVAPYDEFIIKSANDVQLQAVTVAKEKDPKSGKEKTMFWYNDKLTPKQVKRWKEVTRRAVESLNKPFIPFTPLDPLPAAYYTIETPKS
jgi:hypothetical protein